ncbi:5-(carboxyamino)imidazole ribonucleotide synthase [Mammaliicoccus sp. Dog046]|uniref:5-(carboxyamino)imidazole ribonucleotide synthase n=1 Tax=Mammaliicoccus sp. Dog046 TaxID=3034233 RepID=UPI002B262BC2|nr:5-(carboxyamino)imidazole ribonucleotide synthase [Mammaliicoccus sp. Dog046]WQK84741.1 5-(carboxyamino)imidazole ribonucleotide synthase [Mammaliicoccus sp. Dog046]
MTYYNLKPGDMIGIVGGGQLGKMMAQSAQKMGFKVAILDPDKQCPAQFVAHEFINAAFSDESALNQLGEISKVVTYEFENIDSKQLETLTNKYNIPQGSQTVALLQDRLTEKQTLQSANVNIVPFLELKHRQDLEEVIETIGFPFIIKTRFGGYDGKGQSVIKSHDDLNEAIDMVENTTCVVEKYLNLNKEVSITATRDIYGKTVYFPLQENEHRNQILYKTVVPARLNLEEQAINEVEKIISKIHFVGTFTVEFFVTEDEGLYVNEIAPRPHNSGHYSIEACEYSQFDTHIMAVAGWHLPEQINLLKPAIMMNLLGQDMEHLQNDFSDHPDWHVHIYGKTENKVNRKMGHITKLSSDIDKDEAIFNQIFEGRK